MHTFLFGTGEVVLISLSIRMILLDFSSIMLKECLLFHLLPSHCLQLLQHLVESDLVPSFVDLSLVHFRRSYISVLLTPMRSMLDAAVHCINELQLRSVVLVISILYCSLQHTFALSEVCLKALRSCPRFHHSRTASKSLMKS